MRRDKTRPEDILKSFKEKLTVSLEVDSGLTNSQWIEKYTRIFNKSTGQYENFSFKNHEYQIDMIDSEAREVNVMKGCQIGATEIFVRLALALVANYNLTVILTQPDFKMSAGFSKSRINPVIEMSPLVKNLVKDANSMDLKKIGNGQLFVKYTKGAESNALSIPGDVLISDEVDQSDQKNLKLFRSRLEHSKYQWVRNFGTPTIPEYGIHNYFRKYDYKSYAVKCPHCGHWNLFFADPNKPPIDNLSHFLYDEFLEQPPDFPVLFKERLEELAESCYICCSKCRGSLEYSGRLLLPSMSNKLTPVEPKFEWIDMKGNIANKAGERENYFISQIPTGHKTGRQVLLSMAGYEETRDIFNQTFGLPFVSATDKIHDSDFKFLRDLSITKPPFCFLGMDFGLKSNYVLAIPDFSRDMFIIFKYGTLPLFTPEDDMAVVSMILKIMRQYNVVCGVVDALPYQNSVHKLKQAAAEAGMPIADAYFNDRITKTNFNVNDSTVKANRTMQIDKMISDIKSSRTVFSKDIMLAGDKRSFLDQFQRFVKVRGKDGSFSYPSMGKDHYGFAYMYARMALHLFTEYEFSGVANMDCDLTFFNKIHIKS